VLAHSQPRALTGGDVEPLELIAGHLAATLDAAALVERLRQKANMDGLTGLGSRAAFEEELAREEVRSSSARRALLVIDIDHFKKINDAHGHLIGDEALRALAANLREHSDGRSSFRFGGDEFVCLIPSDETRGTVAVAESLCARAEEALVAYDSSVTAGLAIPRDAESPWATFARADDALLKAKVQCRGTIFLSTS
jgi:diguanylate cyclase (GGDEF)-like protein